MMEMKDFNLNFIVPKIGQVAMVISMEDLS